MTLAGAHVRRDGFRWVFAWFAIAGVAVIAGCGKPSGPPRYRITGTVTYAGKQLAAGRIAFEPDTDRGNKGPAGYGDVVNGRYETYRTMGAVGGPHRVIIDIYSKTSSEQIRRRSPLFPPYVTTVDLPLESTSLDFDVPAAKSSSAR